MHAWASCARRPASSATGSTRTINSSASSRATKPDHRVPVASSNGRSVSRPAVLSHRRKMPSPQSASSVSNAAFPPAPDAERSILLCVPRALHTATTIPPPCTSRPDWTFWTTTSGISVTGASAGTSSSATANTWVRRRRGRNRIRPRRPPWLSPLRLSHSAEALSA